MIVVAYNRSKRKAFRRTKRMLSAVLPAIGNRVNLGDVPNRVVLQLMKNLRDGTTKGVCVKLFFQEHEGYRGFKCIEFGPASNALVDFVNVESKFDLDMQAKGLVKVPGDKAVKNNGDKGIPLKYPQQEKRSKTTTYER